ncbi:prepilin peptidase [Kordiimonas gwangyangensis]|uniref:prepilin peptidase n=1 Tax=Kordiimonas gwangyangensis TaxID=288022 RepID=UPI00036D4217|nr:A24 family peptidase [Kordiimonas gwangyangensis]
MDTADTGKRRFIIPALLFLLPLAALLWSDRPLLVSLVLYANLYALALYDHFTFRLPNLLVATLAVVGLLNAYLNAAHMAPYLIGLVAGFIALAALALAYEKLRGRAGLGMGDAKFLGAAGAWVSWAGLPPVLLIASLAGLGGFLVKSVSSGRHNSAEPIPFGPFLCLGLWLVWLYFSPFDA